MDNSQSGSQHKPRVVTNAHWILAHLNCFEGCFEGNRKFVVNTAAVTSTTSADGGGACMG